MEMARLSLSLIISRLGEMTGSLIYFSFIGHFIVDALSSASFVWALASFLHVVGIGFFSTLIVKVASSTDLNEDNIAQELTLSFQYALIFGLVILVCAALYALYSYYLPSNTEASDLKILVLFSLYLPATFIQLIVFNFFNAIKKTCPEMACTWLFNLSLALTGLALITLEKNPHSTTFISLYVALKWLLTLLALYIFSHHIRQELPEFRYHQILSPSVYAHHFSNGLPLALCLGGESFVYLLFSFISKSIGNSSLAAFQLLLHYLSTAYMISIGTGNATGILVARHFALRKFQALRIEYFRGLIFGLFLLTPWLVAPYFFKENIALLYTSDSETRKLIEKNILISIPFLMFEYIYIVTRMTLRSMGDIWVPTILTLSSLNMLGLISALSLLKFYDCSVSSLFFTLVFCSCILMFLLLCRLNQVYKNMYQIDN